MDPKAKAELVKSYQSLMGALVWLTINTRPDLATVTKLLGQYQTNPSAGHMDAARYVLRYLKGTTDFGITFHQSGCETTGHSAWPDAPADGSAYSYSDSNWGPQDASKPRPEDLEDRMVLPHEVKSLQGGIITRMGGPIWWTVLREPRTSRSSCEAEIKSVDAVCRELQGLRYLIQEEPHGHSKRQQGSGRLV